MFGFKKRNRKIIKVPREEELLQETRDLLTRLNEVYADPDWPRKYRLWWDFRSRRTPMLTIQEWEPSSRRVWPKDPL